MTTPALFLAQDAGANTDMIVVLLLLLIFIVLIFMSWLVARATKALESSAHAQQSMAGQHSKGSTGL
jgi:hypothetical protein